MKILSLAGSAQSGKDHFCEMVTEYLSSKELITRRLSFADKLKAELYDFIKINFGFSSFTQNKEQKEIIRPIMVAYGCAKREVSKGTYWLNHVKEKLDSLQKAEFVDVAIITDVRFNEYENDELPWVKAQGGKLVFLERVANGSIIESPNEIEKKHNVEIKKLADFHITWGDGYDSKEIIKEFCDKCLI